MKNLIILCLGLVFATSLYAQDPQLSGAGIDPTPAPLADGETTMELTIVNNSTTPIQYNADDPVVLVISTSRFIPDTEQPTGPGTQYFTWTWECVTACDQIDGEYDENIVYTLKGIQNQVIPGITGGPSGGAAGGELQWTGTPLPTLPSQVSANGGVGFNSNLSATSVNDIDQSNESNSQRTYTYSESEVLPVELQSFDAVGIDSDSKLDWVTASETNSSHFEIERSLDGGTSFETIGRVESLADAAGNSASELSYQFFDKGAAVLGDAIYYRIKQVDLDGPFEFSVIRLVNFGDVINGAKLAPNPLMSGENAIVVMKDITLVEVYSMNGDLVGTIEEANPVNSTSIDTSDLAAGMYYVIVNGKEKMKLIVQ